MGASSCFGGRRAARLQAARLGLTLLLVSASLRGPLAAAATDPSAVSPASLGQSLATVLGISPAQIVEVQGYGLRTQTGVSGVVLARYREGSGLYTFPVLAVYHDCPSGTCQTILRLGQAVARIAPSALVDLDAPAAAVPRLQPVGLRMPVPQPASPPRFPVLLLVSETQRREPGQPGAEAPSEQHLQLVSLKTAGQPALLQTLTLAARWPEPADARTRPPRRIGHQIEGLVLGRQGSEQVLLVRERDLDSRYSRGLRPQAHERRFLLVGTRFLAQPASGSPLDPLP